MPKVTSLLKYLFFISALISITPTIVTHTNSPKATQPMFTRSGVLKTYVSSKPTITAFDITGKSDATTRKYIEEGKDLQGKGFDPRKLLNPGFEAIKAKVKEKMELFGSVGKA